MAGTNHSTNKRVVVVGSFMMDLVTYAPRRPDPGETLAGHSFSMRVGGKGFNQAVAARRAGSPTSMIGAIGDDSYGQKFIEFMDAEDIDHLGVTVLSECGTGVGLPLIQDDGNNSIVIVPRANADVDERLIVQSLEEVPDTSVVLAQLELPINIAEAVGEWTRSHGAMYVLNPAPIQPLPESLLGKVDVLVPNEGELLALEMQGSRFVESDSTRIEAVKEKAAEIVERYGCSVITTVGECGVVVATAGGISEVVPAFRVDNVVDTVGAGDTFCGYLASLLAQEFSISDAAHLANVAAAISVTREGSASSVPQLDELPKEFLSDVMSI